MEDVWGVSVTRVHTRGGVTRVSAQQFARGFEEALFTRANLQTPFGRDTGAFGLWCLRARPASWSLCSVQPGLVRVPGRSEAPHIRRGHGPMPGAWQLGPPRDLLLLRNWASVRKCLSSITDFLFDFYTYHKQVFFKLALY